MKYVSDGIIQLKSELKNSQNALFTDKFRN